MPKTHASTALLTPSERSNRWKFLTKRRPRHRNNLEICHLRNEQLKRKRDPTCQRNDDDEPIDNDDPFDCSDLVVPQISKVVDKEVEVGISKWRELDSRKIAPAWMNGSNNAATAAARKSQEDDSEEEEEVLDHRSHRERGWGIPHFIIPENFDYKCIRGPPMVDNDAAAASSSSNKMRDQVLSLTGCPGQTDDYEYELWKIFNTIPTVEKLEHDIVTNNLCSHTIGLREEIKEVVKVFSRSDGHALTRMRMKDLHHFPTCTSNDQESSNGSASPRLDVDVNKRVKRLLSKAATPVSCEFHGLTVRMEFWKRSLKRGSSSDGNKLEIEFLGTQTLLDVHNAIMKNSRDIFDSFFTKDRGSNSEGGKDDEEKQTKNGTDSKATRGKDTSLNSGMFFIENTFYTTGPVDYAAPIIDWLNNKHNYKTEETAPTSVAATIRTEKELQPPKDSPFKFPRAEILGISLKDIQVKSMHDTRLSDLPIRLGVRYYHTFNGYLESSVFVTDVRANKKHDYARISSQDYPVVLDCWFVSATRFCDACAQLSAVVVCFDDELTDGGPSAMCAECYYKLHYDKDGKLRYNNFRVFPLEVFQQRHMSFQNAPWSTLFQNDRALLH